MPSESSATNRVFQILLSVVILTAGLGGMYTLAGRHVQPRTAVQAAVAPLVMTVAVEPHSGSLDIATDGVVTPYRDISMAAEVAGRIVHKAENCRAGRFVAKGTLLFELDAQDYQLEERRWEKQLEQAESGLADVDVERANIEALIELGKEELALQQVDLARAQNLRDSLADSEVDKARRAEWLSRNSLQTLRNQLELVKSRHRGLESARDLAQVQLDKARLDVLRTKITAPVDGLIVRDLVEQDSYVQKGAELLTIEDTSRAEVKCNLQMNELAWIWRKKSVVSVSADSEIEGPSPSVTTEPGTAGVYELPNTPVTIFFQPLGNTTRYQWKGVLSRFDGLGIDGKTRTVSCRVLVTDPRAVTLGSGATDAASLGGLPTLLRGMYVSVVIHTQPEATFLRVPEVAVQPGKKLFRVKNDTLDVIGPVSLVQLVTIESVDHTPRKVWLLDSAGTDLRAGDSITISPVPSAYSGMAVRHAPETR